MINAYAGVDGRLQALAVSDAASLQAAVWIDLHNPTEDERALVSETLATELPTYQEMHEIEASSRLYHAGRALTMITPALAKADSDTPQLGVLGFVLLPDKLVTLRYLDPRWIELFVRRADRDPGLCRTAQDAFVGLLDTMVDRIADVLELVAGRIDNLSRQVFSEHPKRRGGQRPDLQEVVQAVGRAGDLIAKSRDSLAGISRVIAFFTALKPNLLSRQKASLKTATRDLRSLAEHADFQAQRATFLLDASLGLISQEQNNIVKTFSVAAVAFLPPTLIASIYGMNFTAMPELQSPYGYPVALALMVLSAVLPLWYFRRRGWL